MIPGFPGLASGSTTRGRTTLRREILYNRRVATRFSGGVLTPRPQVNAMRARTPDPSMWIRKTLEEIENECHKPWLALGGPALISFLSFVGSFIMGLVGPFVDESGNNWTTTGPTTWPEAVQHSIRLALVIGIVAFPCAYLYQLLSGRRLFSISREVQICDGCYRVKSPDGEQVCDCGGKFEDLELWKWVND